MKQRYIAKSWDEKTWYPYIWSDYLNCHVQCGSQWPVPPSFNTPEKAIDWAKNVWDGGFKSRKAMLAGIDPTGGLVDVQLQLSEMQRQYHALHGSYC